MIVITGAAGFIGSCMVQHLNESGRQDLVLVEDFSSNPKKTRCDVPQTVSCPDVETFHETFSQGLRYVEKIPRDFFFDWLRLNQQTVDFIIHLGSETDTLPEDTACFHEHILEFSQRLWSFAAMNRIPLLFVASSADDGWHWHGERCGGVIGGMSTAEWTDAGNSKLGLYEQMKRQFDSWVMKQRVTPPLWAGFSMVEVYGPGEAYKGPFASSVWQLYQQFCQKGYMSIPYVGDFYNSENELFKDRVFVKDVVTILTWFINHLPASGFYRLATGYERPLSAVAKAIFSALKKDAKMEFVSVSLLSDKSLQDENQWPLNSLRSVGYKKIFTPLEKGVRVFLRKYLGS